MSRSFGERAADAVSAGVGSWPLIIFQSFILIIWGIWNAIPGLPHWDAYPYIFLNLMLSLQAAYTGPIVLISSKRQEKIQRQTELDILTISRAIHMLVNDQKRQKDQLIEEINDVDI